MRRALFIVAVLAACTALGGCVISTPDTADSGTGFKAEARWPWGQCCPDKGD